MVKTFANIWLEITKPTDEVSVVSSIEPIRSVTLSSGPSNLDYGEINYSTESSEFSHPSSNKPLDSLATDYSGSANPIPIFRDAITKAAFLAVINDCNKKLSFFIPVNERYALKSGQLRSGYKSLEQRFGASLKTNYDNYVINYKYTNRHRLQNFVSTTLYVLKELADEISIFGGATIMFNYLEIFHRKVKEENQMLEDYRKKQQTVKNLQEQLYKTRAARMKECQKLNQKITSITLAMKDEIELEVAKNKFMKKWEQARYEQNYMTLQLKEKHLNLQTSEMTHARTLENICHKNIKQYLSEDQEGFMSEIENWMEKYDRDFDQRQLDIYNVRRDTENLQEEKELLQKKYDKRQEEMNAWNEYKREKQEKKERLVLQIGAVCKIQGWWRMVMFKKKLGPYRPKKTKKNKKNGKKKSMKNDRN